MFYLILAILSSVLIAIIMRISERYTNGGNSMLMFNYAMCLALSVCYTRFTLADGFGFAAGIGTLNGILYMAGFVLLKWNIARNGVILPATFQRLGVIIPTILSVTVFGERPGAMQIIGIVITIAAILFMNGGDRRGDHSYLGLIALLCVAGTTDSVAKVFEQWGSADMTGMFLFITFFVAFIALVIITLVRRERIEKWSVLFGLLVGIPNFFSARFLLGALTQLPGLIVYPTYSISTIAVLSIAGVALFREKLSVRRWISIGGIAVALALLNI